MDRRTRGRVGSSKEARSIGIWVDEQLRSDLGWRVSCDRNLGWTRSAAIGIWGGRGQLRR
uniref:Uncharacterized protein n=1 Tax=Fagus sylvatica TaxID=28930 RepID=A0A2N9FEY3_FAGSY